MGTSLTRGLNVRPSLLFIVIVGSREQRVSVARQVGGKHQCVHVYVNVHAREKERKKERKKERRKERRKERKRTLQYYIVFKLYIHMSYYCTSPGLMLEEAPRWGV